MKPQSARNATLVAALQGIYEERKGEMLFHGWHHITFVARKAVEFAEVLGVDKEIVEAAALTHDLNYLVEVNSEPEAGREMRGDYLKQAGYDGDEVETIEAIVMEEHTATRHAAISDSAKALSDADTLFKALPITPIIFAGHFIRENRIDIQKLARKVVREQQPLIEQGIYFYTDAAKEKYMRWAEVNLQLWQNVEAALADPAVSDMLEVARQLEVI